MSKYDLDLDYGIPLLDISKEELNENIAEADGIIAGNKVSFEKQSQPATDEDVRVAIDNFKALHNDFYK